MIFFNNMLYDIKANATMLMHDIDQKAHESDNVDYDLLEQANLYIKQNEEEKLINLDLWVMGISLFIVNESETLYNALSSHGYTVNKSNISSSLYAINDNGEEIRVSDHKRPAIVEGNIAIYNHDDGYVSNTIKINSNTLIKLGFIKLQQNKIYYLD